MRLDELPDLVGIDRAALNEAFDEEDVLVVLPAQEEGRDEDSALVALDAHLAVVSGRPHGAPVGVDVAPVRWEYVEVGGPASTGWGGTGASFMTRFSVHVRFGEHDLRASFSDPEGEEAIQSFAVVARQKNARELLPERAVGCPECGKVGWHSDGRNVIRAEGGFEPIRVYVVVTEQGAAGPWVGECGHEVPADSRLGRFLDRLEATPAALPPNR